MVIFHCYVSLPEGKTNKGFLTVQPLGSSGNPAGCPWSDHRHAKELLEPSIQFSSARIAWTLEPPGTDGTMADICWPMACTAGHWYQAAAGRTSRGCLGRRSRRKAAAWPASCEAGSTKDVRLPPTSPIFLGAEKVQKHLIKPILGCSFGSCLVFHCFLFASISNIFSQFLASNIG